MQQPVVVLGGEGGGALAAWILQRITARQGTHYFAGFLNDFVAPGATISGGQVVGNFAAWSALPAATHFLAPLHKVKQMHLRAPRIDSLGIPRERWACVIDPDAVISPDVEATPGLFIGPYAVASPGVRLGRHVAVRSGAYLGHNVTLGDFVFVGANAVISGYARVGEATHIAPGAVVRDGLTLGHHAVVGLGTVVVHDVPDFAIIAGNPGREIGRIDPSAPCDIPMGSQ